MQQAITAGFSIPTEELRKKVEESLKPVYLKMGMEVENCGTIVAEAASVVERKDTPKNMKPQYRDGSFCWWVWLVFTGFTWCF